MKSSSLFNKQYKLLHPAQKQAVDAIDGPVLVIAGPGTGKTQLLSMRAANILQKTDSDPGNILCLTFTNKAALNMQKRLQSLIGNDASGINIKTFHSFAAEIMNRHPDYFWNGAHLSTAPDAVQLSIIEKILNELPVKHPLSSRFAGKFTATQDIIKALNFSKQAGLTPSKLEALLKINIAYIDLIENQLTEILSQTLSYKKLSDLKLKILDLPTQKIDQNITPLISLSTVITESLELAIKNDLGTGKTKNVGIWKKRWIQSEAGKKSMFQERQKNQWWLNFCSIYASYRNQLHEKGYFDYADMLLEVIVQLEANPGFLAEVQEQYTHVLIDEFQDSNAAQLRLAHLVSDHHTAEGSPNIMAVGDDDQSIYGFNGAELNNMLYFERNFSSPKIIVLHQNYRSSQEVLEVADQVISSCKDRLINKIEGLDKKLVANNQLKGQIERLELDTQEEQYSYVSAYIKEIVASSSKSVAIIARTHTSLKTLAAILNRDGVNIKYEQQNNILDHEMMKQIILIASAANSIKNGDINKTDELIAKIVQHPMWEFEATELWQLATTKYSRSDWLKTMLESKSDKQKQLALWLTWLASESTRQPLSVLLELIIGLSASKHLTSPLKDYYFSQLNVNDSYLRGLSAVRIIRSLVAEFNSNQSNNELGDFLDFVAVNQSNQNVVSDESTFVSGQNAVELYTIHKVKGLEFDHVFIIDAIDDNWKPRSFGRKPPANLPLQPPGENTDDYIRFMYVALTRSKQDITVTSFKFDEKGKEQICTPIISNFIKIVKPQELDLTKIKILEDNIKWPSLNRELSFKALKPRLENYSLSATHLIEFLDVSRGGPSHFFERRILALPEAKTPELAYGNAFHKAMQRAQSLTNNNEFSLKNITDYFATSLQKESIGQLETEKYIEHGTEVLTKIFNEFNYKLPQSSLAEQMFKDVYLGEARLIGAIDRLDFNDNEILLVDYKTGKTLNSLLTRDKNKATSAWRHRTQLIFYCLLVKTSKRYPGKNLSGQIVYAQSQTAKELQVAYTPSNEELDEISRLIQIVWDKIQNLEFEDTSKYSPDFSGVSEFIEDLLS